MVGRGAVTKKVILKRAIILPTPMQFSHVALLSSNKLLPGSFSSYMVQPSKVNRVFVKAWERTFGF